MLTDENCTDLREKGYTVVSDVLTPEECDTATGQYREWLSQFKECEWPYSAHSILQKYNTGHMVPTWYVRLKTKKVFAQVWKTDKLLSSIDAIVIGRPPEDGQEKFHAPGDHWLHVDHAAVRVGLHAYQGTVYLEEALEDDWTFHLMEGSHHHLESFFETHPAAAIESIENGIYYFTDEEVSEFRQKGCPDMRIAVPKGGMVLWDSRLVHANVRPIKGRRNPGRWRFLTFVSMTPAIWATERDIDKKKEAYDNAYMTSHWSSQGVDFFTRDIPASAPQNVNNPTEVPDIAKTDEAKLLAGIIPYAFNDGDSNGDEHIPVWKDVRYTDDAHACNRNTSVFGGMWPLVLAAGIGIAFYAFRRK